MADISLKDRIVRYIESRTAQNDGVWINGGEIERESLLAGYKTSNASRRLRELAREEVLERKEDERGHVVYRIKKAAYAL